MASVFDFEPDQPQAQAPEGLSPDSPGVHLCSCNPSQWGGYSFGDRETQKGQSKSKEGAHIHGKWRRHPEVLGHQARG